MTDRDELMIYKALFCTKQNMKRVNIAKVLYNNGMVINRHYFRVGVHTRTAYRVRNKMLEYMNG